MRQPCSRLTFDVRQIRMKTPEQYRDDLQGYLDTYIPILIPKLSACLKLSYAADVAFLDFEVFEDSAGIGFPVMFGPTTRGNEVYSENRSILNSNDFCLPDALDACGYNFEYEREEDGFVKVFAPWFRICWATAGGLMHPLPAYVCGHDDIRSFDLRRCIWVDNIEKDKE